MSVRDIGGDSSTVIRPIVELWLRLTGAALHNFA